MTTTAADPTFVALVHITPPHPALGGGSCLAGTATVFNVVGAAVFVDQ